MARLRFRLACAIALATLLALTGMGCGDAAGRADHAATTSSGAPVKRATARAAIAHVRVQPAPTARFAVGERVVTLVDRGRRIRFPGRRPQPRTLVTVIRYPASGPASRTDVRDALPARLAGGFPLIVFGHGFAVTPAIYFRLLRAWAHAGYVVAAPVFPLENAHAPGGPNESDLVNQPRDMRFVISRLLAGNRDPHDPLAGLIAPSRIAVSGQSDGGETALAVAYDPSYLDRRVRAAVILSGALLPGGGPFAFPSPSPPLLASQGTADTINQPRNTYAFFAAARPPKYLLSLLGAPHLPPYTDEQPQLTIVERVTIAFLDRYLKGVGDGLRQMRAAASVPPGRAALTSDP
ncbi:MAG: alpha/beta hydrolase family protein [Solirubrobacteraceae bacterium]